MTAPLLFGWNDQTWKHAFAWAKVDPVAPVLLNNTENLSSEHWDKLIGVHSKWMEQVGDPAGPKGSIIL